MKRLGGVATAVAFVVGGSLAPGLLAAPALAAGPNLGTWVSPFEEDPNNVKYPIAEGPTEHCRNDATLGLVCKPTAVNITVLPNGNLLYWNGLEGFERIQHNTVLEAGLASSNSQARVLTLGESPSWIVPTPSDGGATNPDAGTGPKWPLPGNNGFNNNPNGSGDMFCTDQVHLADGKVLIAGGTAWYASPQVPGTPYGVSELQGTRSVRLFDPATNTFSQLAPMNFGRWYPGLIELGDGRVFVGGGVRKLIQTDGLNVRQTEIYDPATNTWTNNGPTGQAALPLFPRMHLLPNGDVYFGSDGQMYGPAGESADEILYNLRSSYHPSTNTWTPYGFGKLGARSGAFSALLPLKAPYTHADILVGGGTLGAPPGSYIANNLSEIHSFDASNQWQPRFNLGPMLTSRRWYSTSVTLPNDAVAVFSGADKDEVIDPGSEAPVRQAEWYTPWDGQFHALASGSRDRTYHNSAILLPDASVLVGGHSPISADYAYMNNIRHDLTAGTPVATANNFKDPSFEIFRPPYLSDPDRPSISSAPSAVGWGQTFNVNVDNASRITSARLIRLPADTHEVDGNMRSVELPVISRDGTSLTLKAPPTGNVAPPGPYYLFVNKGTGAGTVPSIAAIVTVGNYTSHTPPVIPPKVERRKSDLEALLGALLGSLGPVPAAQATAPASMQAVSSTSPVAGPTPAASVALGGAVALAGFALNFSVRRRRRRRLHQ